MTTPRDTIAVVLVDDEENILRALQRLLMDEDFEVHTAGSGQEGLELLHRISNVALIVSDQRMPGMDGAEFLGCSREIAPHALRILLTGYSDIHATIEAINRGGASRYVSKPWDDEELVGIIRDAVAQYTRESENRRLNEIIDQQNKELEIWNQNLKKRLLQSTTTIREQSQTLKNLDEKHPVAVLNLAFDNFFEVMGDRYAVHARTVSTLVTDVARKMGLDAETVARFRLAALLHDTGKLGSLTVTLNKHVDEMSESELNEYRLHPLRGEAMFRQLDELKEVAPLIRSHHESFDGTGFPDGLAGEAIPLGARLIAIADVLEKSARSVGQQRAVYALMNARFHGGTLLDPKLVSLFQGIARIVYMEGNKTGEVSDVEIGPMELVQGMLLARDVKSGAGVLLLQRGAVLDSAAVAVIRSHYHKNPPSEGIFIQVIDE